jgi:hypothetical protein
VNWGTGAYAAGDAKFEGVSSCATAPTACPTTEETLVPPVVGAGEGLDCGAAYVEPEEKLGKLEEPPPVAVDGIGV